MARHEKNKDKIKKMAIIDLVFILCVFLIIIYFYVALMIRGQKKESVLENRTLAKIPKFNFSSFFSGDYQKQLEDSLTDQMVLSGKIKKVITTRRSTICE